MGSPSVLTLHHDANSPVHRLPAHVKIVALLGYVAAVVATPRELIWPYTLHLALLLGVIAASSVPLTVLSRRLAIETPFVLFALLLPFVATGPTTTLLGLTVSHTGLWAAWALLARGTLGVLAALTLAATTESQDLLHGLRRLRLPGQMVEIMGFMVRYVDVIRDQWHRMRIARESRCFTATTLAGWPILGRSLGAMFIRSYERGERVHLAMLSRGYAGTMPLATTSVATRSQWVLAGTFVAASALISLVGARLQ